MHELGITDHLLTLALKHAEQAGATRITDLHLVIGEFSSVVDESIQFYWDMLTQGTMAEGGKLHFRRVPGRLACSDCNQQFAITSFDGMCPRCGGLNISLLDGDQFRLESIEVEGGTGS